MYKGLIGSVALIAMSVPLAAQSNTATTSAVQPGSRDDPDTPREPMAQDRGYDKPQARTEAINAPVREDTARANAMSSADATTAIAATNADLQAQYDADMTSWLESVSQRDRAVVRNARDHAAQQRAYADAMYVWRMQVRDCERGVRFACNRPTPNPAAYLKK